MKAFGCILISALAIIALVPTSAFDVQPLYGRSFNLFNLLTSPQALLSRLTSLTSRFAILQSTVDILSNQFNALQTIVRSLQAQVTALQTKKCPISTGRTISSITDKCFTVKTVSGALGITWADAQSACLPGGGSLAEPLATATASQAFYLGLKGQFGFQFISIEANAANQIWIGYKNRLAADATVVAPISGASVKFTTTKDPIISAAVDGATTTMAAVINVAAPSGSTWSVIDPAATTVFAYICQYNLV